MGNLLRVIMYPETPSRSSDIFVDFENAEPTESERATWDLVQAVLDSAQNILQELQCYIGATDDIRLAISSPRDDNLQMKAWEAVCPLVAKLKLFYEFSVNLEQVIPKLLLVLCSEDMTPKEHLENQQASFRQFAEILDFVLKFDELKMTNPAIQNDFSYYRRTLNRRKMANQDEIQAGELEVSNEMANRMSLFYAQATPMLKNLSNITSQFVSQHKELPVEQTTDCLSSMANICREMIENPEFNSRIQNEETRFFCLRVMVGVIILYDHVHPVGAFAKTSGIEMKSSVKVLKEQDPVKVEGLLNALRYTTKHLQDESTPRALKTLLT